MVQIIISLITMLTTIALAVIAAVGAYYMARLKQGQIAAAAAVIEVKKDLAANTRAHEDAIAENTELTEKGIQKISEVHDLVNGALGVHMQGEANALRRIADLTTGTPGHAENERAAVNAEKDAQDHMDKLKIAGKA